jgi:hypothetical protein
VVHPIVKCWFVLGFVQRGSDDASVSRDRMAALVVYHRGDKPYREFDPIREKTLHNYV